MIRFLSIAALAICLVVAFVAQPQADEGSKPTVIKVYMSPG